MKIKMNYGLKGHFHLVKYGTDGNIVDEYDFDNLITNNGMNLVGTNGDFHSYCSVGTGTTTPNVTDTELDIYEAYVPDYEYFSVADDLTPYDNVFTAKYIFVPGVLNNVNITELGIGLGTLGTNLFSRQLILDDGGLPTTITVLAGESLLVIWTLITSIDVSTTDSTVSFDNDGTPETLDYVQTVVNVLGNSVLDNYPGLCTQVANPNARGYWGPALVLFRIVIMSSLCVRVNSDVPLTSYESQTPFGLEEAILNPENYSDTTANQKAELFVRDSYVADSWKKTGWAAFNVNQGLYATGIGKVVFWTSWGACQFVFDVDKIDKPDTKVLRFDVEVSWARA